MAPFFFRWTHGQTENRQVISVTLHLHFAARIENYRLVLTAKCARSLFRDGNGNFEFTRYLSRTRNCARLLIIVAILLIVATQSSRLMSSSKSRSHGNNVRDVIIAYMRTHKYTNRRGKRKVILGPARRRAAGW